MKTSRRSMFVTALFCPIAFALGHKSPPLSDYERYKGKTYKIVRFGAQNYIENFDWLTKDVKKTDDKFVLDVWLTEDRAFVYYDFVSGCTTKRLVWGPVIFCCGGSGPLQWGRFSPLLESFSKPLPKNFIMM